MTWKIYVFVKTKDKNGKKHSKGKLAGQVGHVCMRIGHEISIDITNIYQKDGEIKLIFKVDNNIFDQFMTEYHINHEHIETQFYDYEQAGLFCSSAVKDTLTDEYIALAILTDNTIDTRSLKLL